MVESIWMCSFLGNYTSEQAAWNKSGLTLTTQVNQTALQDDHFLSSNTSNEENKLSIPRSGSMSAMSLPFTGAEELSCANKYEVIVLQYLIPALCIFGLFGNILNIGILMKRLTEGVSNIERGSTVGLIALAGSDFGFCLFTLFAALVPNDHMIFERKSLTYFMAIYGSYVINTFIKTSTAFTVILAIGRYYAVCFPLRARQFLKDKYTIIGKWSVLAPPY